MMYENNNGFYQPGGPGSIPPQPPYQPYQPYPLPDAEVDALVEAAFSKSLAATIMCGFPVASIIAIVFGNTGLGLVDRAKRLAAQRGVRPSGKNVAANVLGKIGKIAGIALTAFWGVYFFILLAILMSF